MSSDSPTPESSSSEASEEDISEVSVIARYEAERKRKLAIGLVVITLVVGGIIAGIAASGASLGPKVDVAQATQDAMEDSNDPQCRAMIAGVTDFGERYRTEHATPLEDVLHKDKAKVTAARERITALRAELKKLHEGARAASYRRETELEDINKWFDHVDTEFRLLDLRAEEQIKKLEAEERGEEYVPLKKKTKAVIVGVKESEFDLERPPEEKRDAAILTIHDDFAKFRVWHSGGTHPCGAADEGETPWVAPAS